MRKSTFHQRLREVAGNDRGAKTKLASKIGVSRQMLNKWLSGTSQPGVEMLPKIVAVTGVSYEWLVEGKGEKHGAKLPANINVVLPRGGSPGARPLFGSLP